MILRNKPVGVTPFQLIHKITEKHPELKNEKIGYAGRLDPIAHGLMLYLVGDENKNKQQFEGLDKEYTFKVAVGIESDTDDVLGVVKQGISDALKSRNWVDHEKINKNEDGKKTCSERTIEKTESMIEFLTGLSGEYSLPFHPFSAKRLDGKPLFYWERMGKLEKERIPIKKSFIHFVKYQKTEVSKFELIYKESKKRISLARGEFRQDEVLESWRKAWKLLKGKDVSVATFSCKVSSGTYIRSLVKKTKEETGIPCMCTDILRTKIGNYSLNDIEF